MCVTVRVQFGKVNWFTSAMLSLAAKASMSAHETTPEHAFSTRALMRSMTSNPRRLVLGPAFFSAVLPVVESISTDASHPCAARHKHRR
jgi:hypothetical protein